MSKKILIVSLSRLKSDPRVYRQISFLKDSYRITAAGLSDPEIGGVEYIPLESSVSSLRGKLLNFFRLKARRFEDFYWSLNSIRYAFKRLSTEPCDLLLANDLVLLPLAVGLAEEKKTEVFLDSHDYTPRECDHNPLWRFEFQGFWEYVCRTYLPRVSAMTTVCEGIAHEYRRLYGTPCRVITNAPFLVNQAPSEVGDDRVRMVHHGGLIRSRKMENMIRLMKHLDPRFRLTFMLIDNDRSYLEKLKNLASKSKRITFRDPVPMQDLSRVLNDYDLGLYLLNPASFNDRMALPNKFFEFIQARLAVAVWPTPEMARLVNAHDLGVVSEDFTLQSMAGRLNALKTGDILRYKQNAHRAATSLCAEKNRDRLLNLVAGLIGT